MEPTSSSARTLIYGVPDYLARDSETLVPAGSPQFTLARRFARVSFLDYDRIIILEADVVGESPKLPLQQKEDFLIRKEEAVACLQQGRFLLAAYNHLGPQLFPGAGAVGIDNLAYFLLTYARVMSQATLTSTSSVSVKEEFAGFAQEYAKGFATFAVNESDANLDVLSRSAESKEVTGFVKSFANRAMLGLLPAFLPPNRLTSTQPLELLAHSLDEYCSSRIAGRGAVGEASRELFTFHSENVLETRLQKLRQELEAAQQQRRWLEEARALPYQRGEELLAGVGRIFENLGYCVGRREGGRSFILEDGQTSQALMLLRVEAPEQNINRHDLQRLDLERADRIGNDDFPALLIANIFASAPNLVDKDAPIPPALVQRMLQDKLVVMRLLDLLRVYDIYMQGRIKLENLMGAVLKRAGWIEAKDSSTILFHSESGGPSREALSADKVRSITDRQQSGQR
ncbi:MAG TPA: hypothetical protein VIH17_03420 [Candidatus Acidoferrales bacterium]